jgi:hypothetical protein
MSEKYTIYTTNGHILTKPLVVQNIESSVKGGFLTIKNKTTFQFVEVVYGDGKNYGAGMQVMLKSDAFVHPWAKQRYEIDGQECILVPISEIVGVKVPQFDTIPLGLFDREKK